MFPDQPFVHQTLFRAISVSLGLIPDSEAAAARILRAYQAPLPAQSAREMNLCFYDLSPDVSSPMFTEHAVLRGIHGIYRFMPYLLSLVFYGPFAETDALLLRENLFIDGAGCPRSILRQAQVFPVPAVRPPSVLYEETDSLYRKRADLVIPLRILDNSDDPASGALPANPITVAPEIIPHVR